MFFGGTNFGFTAGKLYLCVRCIAAIIYIIFSTKKIPFLGANDFGFGKYAADITSYDYDAVMDESGDPNGLKYVKVKEVIEKHFNLTPKPVPSNTRKISISSFQLQPLGGLLSTLGRKHFGHIRPHVSERPLSFEEIKQFSGFVLYETNLPKLEIDPTRLKVNGLRDRALVYVNQHFIGILSRENVIDSLPITSGMGAQLQILVENQGRINYNIADDKKVG